MKKGLIFATTLAMALGVGVAVGAHQGKAAEVKADYTSRTVYCAIDTTTLGSYSLKLNCNVGDNNTWVQSDMVDLNDTTSYPGKKVFKGTFEERYNGVDAMQFQLYDGSSWKEQDQVISSYTTYEKYSGKLHVYGGAAESWAAYAEPTPPEPEPPTPVDQNYYLKGDFNDWEVSESYKFTVDSEDANHYVLEHVEIEAGQGMKGFQAENNWFGVDHAYEDCGWTVGTGEDAGNCIVTNASTYTVNLYVNSEDGNHLSIVDEIEHVYTVKVGETSYGLELNEGSEYKLDVEGDKIDLFHGTTVAVYKDDSLDTSFASKPIGNNNLDEDSKIIATSEGQIYVDMSAKTLFVGGLPFGGYHLLKSDAIIEMTHVADFDGYIQYMAASISFAADDTVKFIDTNGGGEEHGYKDPAVVWAIGKVNEAGLGDKFEVVKNEFEEVQYIRCKEECTASVYMKLKPGLDEVYFGNVPEYIEEAIAFADGFEQAMAESCSATDPAVKKNEVELAWSEAAEVFGELSEQAQAELKLGNLSSQKEVREFGERYAGIYTQLGGEYDLDEFLDWKLTPKARYNDFNFTSADSTAIIVMSIAAVSALAFTLLLVFKKKKQK